MLSGDLETGKALLRDYINATIGFEPLAEAVGKSPKSLMRMLPAARERRRAFTDKSRIIGYAESAKNVTHFGHKTSHIYTLKIVK